MADAISTGDMLDESISRTAELMATGRPASNALSPVAAIDYNAPGCCTTGWSYQLNVGTGATNIAFSTDIWASRMWNPHPSQYPGANYQFIGANDSTDNVFIQIGYAVDAGGNEYLFAWTSQANGAVCASGAVPSYPNGQGCTAPFSNFAVADQTWIQFWIYQNNGFDVLYVNNTPFMSRSAAAPGHLMGAYDSSEVSTYTNLDMTAMMAAGLGLGGFFDLFSYWTGTWTNQTPLTATSLQFDEAGHSYFGNYFDQGAACGPAGNFGQFEPYGKGSGGYWAGTANTQCLANQAILPGS